MKNNFILDKEIELKRKIIIKQLKFEREYVRREIDRFSKLLSEKQTTLDEINKALCSIQGHTFTPWIKKPDKLDDERLWFYERKCEICGHIETKEKNELEDLPLLTKKNNSKQ